MRHPGRIFACALFAAMLCLTGCMRSAPLKLSSRKDFRREMLDKYNCIRHLEAEQYYPWLDVNIYYGGDTLPEETREEILEDFHAFLSGEEFLAEYVPYGLEHVSDQEVYVDPPMPDINIEIMRYGSDTREYTSSASYYAGGYRSDRKMTVDNYQTWSDLDRTTNTWIVPSETE